MEYSSKEETWKKLIQEIYGSGKPQKKWCVEKGIIYIYALPFLIEWQGILKRDDYLTLMVIFIYYMRFNIKVPRFIIKMKRGYF